METEKSRFLNTVRRDVENGLVNMAFDRNSNGAGSSEEVYAEINAMWSSENKKNVNEQL